MEIEHEPPPDTSSALAELLQSNSRARLRAAMPVIHHLTSKGVPHAEIVGKLVATGIPVTLGSMRKALYRWRKKHPQRPGIDIPDAGESSPSRAPTSHQPKRAATSSIITSKADLVQHQRAAEHLDLQHLAEIGRQTK